MIEMSGLERWTWMESLIAMGAITLIAVLRMRMRRQRDNTQRMNVTTVKRRSDKSTPKHAPLAPSNQTPQPRWIAGLAKFAGLDFSTGADRKNERKNERKIDEDNADISRRNELRRARQERLGIVAGHSRHGAPLNPIIANATSSDTAHHRGETPQNAMNHVTTTLEDASASQRHGNNKNDDDTEPSQPFPYQRYWLQVIFALISILLIIGFYAAAKVLVWIRG